MKASLRAYADSEVRSGISLSANRIILTTEYILRKHACSKIKKISPAKTEIVLIKTDIFHISAKNIHCGYSLEQPQRGGSNVYPQSMFLSRNKKK